MKALLFRLAMKTPLGRRAFKWFLLRGTRWPS